MSEFLWMIVCCVGGYCVCSDGGRVRMCSDVLCCGACVG